MDLWLSGRSSGSEAKPHFLPETFERYPQRTKKDIHEGREGKKISTKGHEERQRATKGLEEAREGHAKGRARGKDFHEKAKRYPRRATKNGEGPLRGWRRLERDSPEVGQGEKISTKRQKDIHEGPLRTTKGHEGVGGGSKGIRQRSGRESAEGFQGVGKDSKGVGEKAKRYPPRATEDKPIPPFSISTVPLKIRGNCVSISET